MPKFECDQCGACCCKLIVEIEEIDLIREPKLIGKARPIKLLPGEVMVDDDGEPCEEIVPGYGAGGILSVGKPCPMLEGNLCSIYSTRPTVCVGFRAGDEQCQLARELAGLEPLQPVESQ